MTAQGGLCLQQSGDGDGAAGQGPGQKSGPFSGQEGEMLSPEECDMQAEDRQVDGKPATQILCVARSRGHGSKDREQDAASARVTR